MKSRRAALILLTVPALLAGGIVASAHAPGPTGLAIPDPVDGRIHSCYQGVLPTERIVRLVTSTETCLLTVAVGATTIATVPIENGVDWPANGVLTRLTDSPPVAVDLPAIAMTSNSAVISCGGKQAIGVTFSSPGAAPVVLAGSTRGGTPAGTELTVAFANLTATAQTIFARALCVTSFTQ
jgi:hypothetical protein